MTHSTHVYFTLSLTAGNSTHFLAFKNTTGFLVLEHNKLFNHLPAIIAEYMRGLSTPRKQHVAPKKTMQHI